MFGMRDKVVIILLSFMVLSVSGFLNAEESENEKPFSVKEGIYLELFGVYNQVGGDFDDSSVLVSFPTIYDIPDVDPGIGFGLALGRRYDKGAIEVSYQRSTHDTTSSFIGVGEQKGYLNTLDLNFKIDVFAKEKIRPHILLGFGFPWLTITDSQVELYGVKNKDETFSGLSGNIGFGLSQFMNPQMCVTAGVMYRYMMFTSVDGLSIEDDLSAGGLSFRLGLSFTF